MLPVDRSATGGLTVGRAVDARPDDPASVRRVARTSRPRSRSGRRRRAGALRRRRAARRPAIAVGVDSRARARISSVCSPRSGGGVRIVAGVRSKLERDARPGGSTPSAGCSSSTRHAERRRPPATRTPPRMSLIGPAGIAGGVEAASQSRGRPLRRTGAARIGCSSARLLDPVAVRRESRVAGQLGQPERRAEPRPLPLATRRPPPARRRAVVERLVRDDVRVGVAEPARGAAGHERVLGLVDEDRQRRRRAARRRSAGRARDRRPLVAARASERRPGSPTAPNSPVTTSLIATPTLVGWPPSASASPVIDISPRPPGSRSRSRAGRRPGPRGP